MMVMLCWLTVSAPFIVASLQQLAQQQKMSAVEVPGTDSQEESGDSGSNNIEEKVPNDTSIAEEFLHDHHTTDCFFTIMSTFHKSENADAYQAFHGELLVPPPNSA